MTKNNVRKYNSLTAKKARWGYLFVLPLVIGLLFMFIIPMFNSLLFSLSNVTLKSGGFVTKYKGLGNFYDALFVDTTFRQYAFTSIQNTVLNVPIIIVFSFFSAALLHKKFFGRSVIRTVFLIPIALASTAMIYMDASDALSTVVGGVAAKSSSALGEGVQTTGVIITSLLSAGLPENMINYLLAVTDRIYSIVIYSGVPTLIILAGLQSIPGALYEAATIEGATSWETFWKITFPMSSNLVITAVIYAVIDSFRASTNPTFSLIQYNTYTTQNFGLAAAMSWIYFTLIMLLIGVVFLISKKAVFYNE